MESYTHVLPPAQHIPPEIWAHVFKLASKRSFDGYCRSFKSDEAPLLLTRVCGLWREIAIGTPQIWSHIILRSKSYCSGHPVELLRTFLGRSCSLPLTIDFDRPHSDDSNISKKQRDLFDIILDCLIPHSHRWKNVNLSLFPDHFQPKWFRLLSAKFEILQTLSIRNDHVADGSDSDWKPEYFSDAPLLESLSTTCLNFQQSNAFTWSSLNEVYLYISSVQTFFNILCLLPNLQSLHFDTGTDTVPPYDLENLPAVNHRFLKNLSIATEDLRMLSRLSFPSLKVLELDGEFSGRGIQNFTEFLTRTPRRMYFQMRHGDWTELFLAVIQAQNTVSLDVQVEEEIYLNQIIDVLEEYTAYASNSDSDVTELSLEYLHITFSVLHWTRNECTAKQSLIRLKKIVVTLCELITSGQNLSKVPHMNYILIEASVSKATEEELGILREMESLGYDCFGMDLTVY